MAEWLVLLHMGRQSWKSRSPKNHKNEIINPSKIKIRVVAISGNYHLPPQFHNGQRKRLSTLCPLRNRLINNIAKQAHRILDISSGYTTFVLG